ncbi:MAG: hypothetical protein OT477_08015 [Chloroflexi bacterium]|nr:hypothetical protein [Chloroflexota bacterium]
MSTAAPLPTAHATTHVPAGLTATDWAQIWSQLALEAIASLNEQAKLTASDPDCHQSSDTLLYNRKHLAPLPAISLHWLAIRRP